MTIRSSTGNPGELAQWVVYYPRHLLKDLDPDRWSEWEFWRHPIGNGPYRFVQHLPETATVLEANPDAFGGKPRIERIVLKFGDFGGRAITELLSGQVDLMPEMDAALWLTLRLDERFRVHHSAAAARRAIYWRNDHLLFQDVRVRRALTLAINRRELLGVVNYPPTTPIIDAPYTSRQLQRDNLPEPLPYDPAQARTLLDAAGWHARGPDGILVRDGRPFRFTALVHTGVQDEIAAIFRRDLPVTFLFPSLLTSFAHRRIRGLETPWAELFAKPEDPWIED